PLANAPRSRDDLHVGLSPRGALALAQAARATAVLRERDYAVPEDIIDNVLPVCAHRMIGRTYTTPGRFGGGGGGGGFPPDSPQGILTEILEVLPSPA